MNHCHRACVLDCGGNPGFAGATPLSNGARVPNAKLLFDVARRPKAVSQPPHSKTLRRFGRLNGKRRRFANRKSSSQPRHEALTNRLMKSFDDSQIAHRGYEPVISRLRLGLRWQSRLCGSDTAFEWHSCFKCQTAVRCRTTSKSGVTATALQDASAVATSVCQ